MAFICQSCAASVPEMRATCEHCGGFVRYVESDSDRLHDAIDGNPTAALPQFGIDVAMGEGETPLVGLQRLEDIDATVYGKLESLNPTCSFKDRGSALAVSAVADAGTSWEAVVVASTGNTAPSIAAYAARADVPCAVLVPDGTSFSKLSQVNMHGVDIYTVTGTFSDCFQFAQRASDERVLNATAVYSANPFVASANRTVAFEIVEQLEHVPDWVIVPVGAGPLLGGTHLGFTELYEADIIDSQPRMLCVQAHGCHPIVRAIERSEPVRPWTEPIMTDIDAIADPLDGYAADGEETRRAVVDSDGTAVALDDETIHSWTDRLAVTEGVYAEPASAASVAAVSTNVIDADDTVVGLITGHGLKEPSEREPPTKSISDNLNRLRSALL
jgi:threonine synthase